MTLDNPPPLGWAINIIRCMVGTMFCVLKNIGKIIDADGFSKTSPKHCIVKEKAQCFACSNLFSFLFSDKINQIGVLHLKNFHFSLTIFKNGVKTEYKPYFG